MKPKLLDIHFVNQATRTQFKHAVGRTLAKPEPKPVKPKPEPNPLWTSPLITNRQA